MNLSVYEKNSNSLVIMSVVSIARIFVFLNESLENKNKSGFLTRKTLKHVYNIIVKFTRYNQQCTLYYKHISY